MALLPLPMSMSSSGPASSCLSPPPSLGSHGLPLARRRADRCPVSERRTGALSVVCLRGGYSDLMTEKDVNATFGRHSFPRGFTFGAASSAFQIEGAWNEEGKGPSIWDTFTHKFPDHIADRSTADIAVDSYHRYKEDVKLLKDMNMDAYRFSISWPRILPNGSLKGGVNQEGINYYNNLINELIANGITPFVTLFHWDVPQALEDEYDGFRSKKIVDDFKDFCDVCFGEFGDRVKQWITLNEPWSFATMGYGLGSMAPGRCSPLPYFNCPVPSGNSVEEPYVVTHNEILAHGAAAKLYREKYQTKQGGQIGITLVSLWFEPWDPEHPNFEASIRALDFMLAWYIDPLQHGDYPFAMKSLVRERLPVFTPEESEMLKKASYDFIGINYYSARYASPLPFVHDQPPFISVNDSYAQQDPEKNGQLIGEWNGSWLYVYPPGIHRLLMYLKRRFNNPPVYITENGYSQVDHDMSKEEAIADDVRKDYIESHLREVSSAIRQGANVKGYFAWSLTDNYEWEKGYTERFGLNYVDYETLKRYPKNSAKWFAEFLKPKRVPRPLSVPQSSMKWVN